MKKLYAALIDEGEKRARGAGQFLIETQGPGLSLKTIDGKHITVIAVNTGFSDNETAIRALKSKVAIPPSHGD